MSDLFLSQAAVQSHLIASNASHPTWASGKSKLISGPVTSWPERPAAGQPAGGAARDPPRTSTSQKVQEVTPVFSSDYIPCTLNPCYQRVHASGLEVEHALCYAPDCRFKANPNILHTFFSRTYSWVQVHTRFISVHTGMYWVYDSTYSSGIV